MANERVIEALRDSIRQDSDTFLWAMAEVAKLPADVPEDVRHSHFVRFASKPVAEALSDFEEFQHPAKYSLRSAFRTRFYVGHAAELAFRLASNGQAPTEVIDYLVGLLKSEVVSGQWVAPLWGLSVSESVRITDDIALVPFNELPDTPTLRAAFTDPATTIRAARLRLGRPPSVAMTIRQSIKPFRFDFSNYELGNLSDEIPNIDAILNLTHALTLVGPCSPQLSSIWFEFDNPDLAEITGFTVSSAHHDVMGSFLLQDKLIDAAEVVEVLIGYATLPEEVRRRVLLAIVRLNQAMRRFGGDKAIELAIALETLLIESPGENTYKIGLRTGLLVEGSLAEKLSARSTVSALYDIRSKLMHTGSAPDSVKVYGRGKQATYDVVSESCDIVAKIVKAIIRRRAVPKKEEWASLELSGGTVVRPAPSSETDRPEAF